VQITETDLSQRSSQETGTIAFVPGFASQGPIDEVLTLSTVDELVNVYGAPTNAAERYFHYTCREILNSPSTVLTTRLPYGSGSGGSELQYSALLYPAVSSASGFALAAPTHLTLSETSYNKLLQGDFTWVAPAAGSIPAGASFASTLSAGVVVLNKSQFVNNEAGEGYFTALVDNSKFEPGTNFDSINQVFTVSNTSGTQTALSASKLNIALSGVNIDNKDSVSRILQSIPTFNFNSATFADSVVLGVFRTSVSYYQTQTLNINLTESHIGSLNRNSQKIINGTLRNDFLPSMINGVSPNIQVLVHPAIADTDWNDKVVTNSDKSLRPLGSFKASYESTNKKVGDVRAKLSRALSLVESTEDIDVDVVIEGGLGTIYAFASAGDGFRDDLFIPHTDITTGNNLVGRWKTIAQDLINFAQNSRRDCMALLDLYRPTVVNGSNAKNVDSLDYNFTSNVFNPIKNTITGLDTSYGALYGNWVKVIDGWSNEAAWVPFSGYAGAVYARNDFATQPWQAPAGLNRGNFGNVVDIAINPNARQRDMLYTVSVNPVVYMRNDGYCIWGQKTLQNKPSAFDRVNVRRLFLALERSTQKALRYYVFEPNTEFTRTRLINTISPLFEFAKSTEGLYEYNLVCDARNNTPDTIDNNELRVDIYIKPTRTAEFILVNFIATRTGQNFDEII